MQAFLPAGVLSAIVAQTLWGLLPLAFRLVAHVEPAMVVASRIFWSIPFVLLVLFAMRRMDEIKVALADRKSFGIIFLGAVLLGCNWLIYVWAVNHNQVLQASFGYFICPLVQIALGFFLLKEKMRRLQLVAILIACIAVGVQTIGLSAVPWIAISLAGTFGFYAYIRKISGIRPMPGLLLETVFLLPFVFVYVGYNFYTEGLAVYTDISTLALLVLMGPLTAIPLVAFAQAVKKLSLKTIGMMQYGAPTLQFIIGAFIFHEPINSLKLISFVLVWVSISVFVIDSFQSNSRTELRIS